MATMKPSGFIVSFVVIVSAWLLFKADGLHSQSAASTIAVVNGLLYVSPTSAALADGVVLIDGTNIAQVGSRATVRIPDSAQVIDASGGAIVAGFQNSHVHFTEPTWTAVATQPAGQLQSQLETMLTRYGFTTVIDTGSSPIETIALRRRIDSGEVAGPRLLTAGVPLYPAGALPYYVRDALPAEVLSQLPQPDSAKAARAAVLTNLQAGTDLIKLFTGSWVTNQRVQPMAAEVASAAAAEAHANRRLVFSHASNVSGLEVALDAGVDVLAHALDDTRGLTSAHLRRMVAARMAMVPTLALFSGKPEVVTEVRDFDRAGGQILFGTDVGFHQTYDPAGEYRLMQQAGLDWRQILASLTTNPAARFADASRGEIAAAKAADLVVLDADPADDVTAFARVRQTIRAGRVIYSR